MNILWISLYPPLPLNYGGPIGIYKRLMEVIKEHNVYLFYMDDEIDIEHLKQLQVLCKEVHPYKRNGKRELSVLMRFLSQPLTVATRYNRKMEQEIVECIKNNSIDLINIEFPQMCVNILKTYKDIQVPIVLHEHNNEWIRFRQMAEASTGITKYLYCLESKKLLRFESLIEKTGMVKMYTFLSTDDKKTHEETFGVQSSRTALIPLGGDVVDCLERKHDGKNILFCAAMDSEMNQEAAVWFVNDVFPLIREQEPNVKFYIVGRQPSEEIMNLANESVIVTGTVPSVDEYYEMADVVVIPLLHGGGVKVKLLEAIGRKKKVVTTNIGIEGTSFVPQKHIYVANEAEKFAEYSLKVLSGGEEIESIYSSMWEHFLQNYTWDKIGKKYRNLFEDIVNK